MGFKILATSDEQAREFSEAASEAGMEIDGEVVWNGFVPPNSYMFIAPFVRMSTPEFYLFRMVASNGDERALMYVCEMLSHVATRLTRQDVGDGKYVMLMGPRTTALMMHAYLLPIGGEENERVAERCSSLIMYAIDNGMVSAYEKNVAEELELSCQEE